MFCRDPFLDPLLSILRINDIAKISKTMELILFPDNTNIFMSDKCFDSLINRINIEITKIFKSFKVKKLLI